MIWSHRGPRRPCMWTSSQPMAEYLVLNAHKCFTKRPIKRPTKIVLIKDMTPHHHKGLVLIYNISTHLSQVAKRPSKRFSMKSGATSGAGVRHNFQMTTNYSRHLLKSFIRGNNGRCRPILPMYIYIIEAEIGCIILCKQPDNNGLYYI